MEHSPPPVTIVNPNAPAGTADLLAHGRDPWRPSRRQAVVTVGALAVAGALAAGVALVVQHIRAERADREAVRTMAFTVNVDPPWGEPDAEALRVDLIHSGPFGATVDDVRLDAPGFTAVEVSESVSGHGGLTVDVPTSSRCDPGLYTSGPVGLVVRARTARGTPVTVRVPFEPGKAVEIWSRLRTACRFQLPEDALSGSVVDASLRGRTLTLRYVLSNSAALPLVLDSITAVDGITLTARGLPLTIPAGSGNYETFGQRRLTVTLRVSDCPALRRQVASAVGGDGLDGPNNLRVAVHHRHAAGDTWLFLDEVVGSESIVNHFQPLLDTCP